MPHNLHHAQEWLRQELGKEPSAGDAGTGVVFVSTIEDAVREADLAIDCVPDELESKLEIFSLMDRMAPPRTVFATPTTNLSIADLASCTYRPGQCVGIAVNAGVFAHDSDVAVIPIRITSQTTVGTRELVCEFWLSLGYITATELDTAEAMLR